MVQCRCLFAQHWDEVLLGLLIVFLCGLLVSLLTPQPVSHWKIQSYSGGNPLVSAPADEVTLNETDMESAQAGQAILPTSERRHHTRKVHHASPKKPKHPPVLNMNTATLAQFQLFTGIGPKMAQRIVDYRKAHGPFQTVEQIMDVKGIGPKKFEKMKPYLKL